MSNEDIKKKAQDAAIYHEVMTLGKTKAEVGRTFNIHPRSVGRAIDRHIANSAEDNDRSDDWDNLADFPSETEVTLIDCSDEPEETFYSVIATSNSITITKGDDTAVCVEGDEKFKEVFDIVWEGKGSQESLAEAYFLISTKERFEVLSKGEVTIDAEQGSVTFRGDPIAPDLEERIVEAVLEKDERALNALVKFTENLNLNPSYRAVNELFGFLQHNDIKITDAGTFIAWKRVRENYMDVYSNTIDNSPGMRVSMPRNKVNENPNETCSHGLHVCAEGYLQYYSGARVVAVEVHPMDVVAVPTDYNNQKMRTCEYLVLEDVTEKYEDIL